MTEFRAGQSANAAHRALKSSLQTMARAKQCAVLWFGEILGRKLYAELGYSSINQYAKVELGFSTSRTGDFLSLCRKLEKLPQVKEQVATGKLGYTAARVLVSVADQSNEGAWVKVALENSRRELERQVKQAKREAALERSGQASLLPAPKTQPKAVMPVRMSLEMTPTQFARFEALWEQLRKAGGLPAGKVEALLAIMAAHGGQSSPRGEAKPPVQIHIHQCPDCEKATVATSRCELCLGVTELDQARCDCQISGPGEPNRSAIPPATRRRVLTRDRHQYQAPGCTRTHYLEIHHKVPRARGGTNAQDNLTTLCSACHRIRHTADRVSSPQAVYRYRQ